MRINRFLATCGVCSRRGAEDLVRAGRVELDGAVVTDLGTQVGEGASVRVDGKPVSLPRTGRVVLLNKPPQVMTTREDPQGRRTVYHYLPRDLHRLVYVGRLDYPSRGLLAFTDDGELLHRLTHPRWEHPKRYRVETERELSPDDLARFREGAIRLPGERPLRPAPIEPVGERLYDIELREGRHRQIRRMMDALGHDVLDLCRTGVGEWTLDGLEEGQWRELSEPEIAPMRAALSLS